MNLGIFYGIEQIATLPPPQLQPYLLKELGHLTHQTGVGLHLTLVSVGQEEVPQQGCMGEGLDDTVHKTRVAQVDQTSKT